MKDEHRALADRLVSYADAIVAVSFLGTSGLGIAIADPDTRTSIARAWAEVAIFNLVLPAVITLILLMLRRWEQDLRAELDESPKAARYSLRLHWARLFLVWFASLQIVGMMFAIR